MISRTHRSFLISLLLIVFFCVTPKNVFATFTAIYASDGNDGYTFTGCFTVANLKSSCWNGVIMFASTVQPNGDITAGGTTLVHNGVYMGDANWGSNVTNLKTPPTSVSRYELCVGGWGDTSWANIESIINSQGAYGILYQNFLALKNACPNLDAINDDDEGNYDVNSATTFGQMLYNSVGLKLSQVPYTNQGFWVQLKNNLGAACDLVYLQCYQGGAGNDPGQWDSAYGNGFHVIPGEETNYASQSQFTTWANNDGITGGFFWPDWYWCPGTNWPTQIAAGIGVNCSLASVTPYLNVNGTGWQQTNSANVPYNATVNLGPQDSGESWSWTGPNGFTATSREIDNIPLVVGVNTFTVTNTTECICNQSNTFTITMAGPPACNTSGLIGNNATGTTWYNQAGDLDCTAFTFPQPITVTSISAYMGTGTTGNGVVGIYTNNGGVPGTLLVQSNAYGLTTGWNTFTLAPTVLAAGTYYLAGNFSGTANYAFGGSGPGLQFQSYTYTGSLPNAPTGSWTGYGWSMCIYASGCQQPTPTATVTPTYTWTVPPCNTTANTFGSTAAGTAGYNQGGELECSSYTLSQPTTITSMQIYMMSGTSGGGVLGIYSNNGGNPGSLLVQSNAQSLSTGWNYFVVTPTVLQPGTYFLSGSFTGTANYGFVGNGTGLLFQGYSYNGNMPGTAPASGWTGYGWSMSIYASGCLQPTATMTNTVTNTQTHTSTNTVTNTQTVTNSQTRTNTSTSTATNTATHTSTSTSTHTSTSTATSTATNTSTHTETHTATSTATSTSTHTNTWTCTYTETPSSTSTSTSTSTHTSTVTETETCTSTPTYTGTSTSSSTPTSTKTCTSTPTNTITPKFTNTNTATSTQTVTNTPSVEKPVAYPNPVTGDRVNLAVPKSDPSEVTVEIFTLSFREVQTVRVSQLMGNIITILLYDKTGMALANGLYYFRVTVDGQKWITKVLVLR